MCFDTVLSVNLVSFAMFPSHDRRGRALENARLREEKAKGKVYNILTGVLAETYKKKSGSWHIGKIANDTKLTDKTVSKHIKALVAENKI